MEAGPFLFFGLSLLLAEDLASVTEGSLAQGFFLDDGHMVGKLTASANPKC
jgi:hypothetical protein